MSRISMRTVAVAMILIALAGCGAGGATQGPSAIAPSRQANPQVIEHHIQLIPAGGPLSLAEVNATFDPDPRCR
jgi:predicted small lipoprotein YifL